MRREAIAADRARHVLPQALRNYAQALGWQHEFDINGRVAVYHRPDSLAHQVQIPLNETFDDYADSVALAVARLAEYEKRPVAEVLDQLLLPPSDLLHFRDTGPEAEDGTLPLTQVVELVAGAKKALLAQAHSLLQPLPFHSRLGRADAERFVNACRFRQATRGGFTVVLACPLDAVPSEASLFERQPPFTRRVIVALMENLVCLADAADQKRAEELLRRDRYPLISANLCEAIVQMRPPGDRPSLLVSAQWSSTVPLESKSIPYEVRLNQEVFAVAESLAPRLRTPPTPQPDEYVGFVGVLRGQPGPDGRPAGEVMVTIVKDDELIRAWLNLFEDSYEVATRAHMTNHPVCFRGVLYRAPGVSRVERVSDFAQVEVPLTQGAGQT